MDPLTPGTGIVLQAVHIPAIIACIACFKFRWLADYFFLTESIIQCLAVVHLNFASYNMDYKELTVRTVLHYLQFAMASRLDAFTNMLSVGFQSFVGLNVVYNRPVTIDVIFLYILTMFLAGFTAILFNMMLIFFSEVN